MNEVEIIENYGNAKIIVNGQIQKASLENWISDKVITTFSANIIA